MSPRNAAQSGPHQVERSKQPPLLLQCVQPLHIPRPCSVISVPLQQSDHQIRPLRLVPALHGVQPLAHFAFAKRL
jgi:hypothetical protein